MDLLGKSTKHYKNNLYSSFSNYSKKLKRREIYPNFKFILWSHHHSNTKTTQRHYRRRKLQASIFDEYRCKNPQQNISKSDSAVYESSPQPIGGVHLEDADMFNIRKPSNVIDQTDRWKDKNYMILSTGQGKASGNIQHSSIIKTLSRHPQLD